MMQGDRTMVLIDDTLTPLNAYLSPLKERLIRFTEGYGFVSFRQHRRYKYDFFDFPDRVWEDAFPMVVEQHPFFIVICDSNDISSHIATNALGRIGDGQIKKIMKVLKLLDEKPVLVAVHHHIGMPRASKDNLAGRFLCLVNAGDFLHALGVTNKRRIIFNGHHHVCYIGSVGDNVRVISAPSTSIGNEDCTLCGEINGFGIHGISWADDGSVTHSSVRWYREPDTAGNTQFRVDRCEKL